MFYRAVDQNAPTREKYHLALEQCWIRLELTVLVFCILFARSAMVMGERLERSLPWDNLSWGSGLSLVLTQFLDTYWIDGWRIAMGALCLSWTVGMRFFGTGGIVQCSPFLLPSNPFQGMIQSTISLLKSPDAILDSLVGPVPPHTQANSASESPTTRSKTEALSNKRIQYSKPHLTTIIMQIIFHALGGYLYSKSMTATTGNETVDKKTSTTITMICCIITSIATLITSYVIQTSKVIPHELSIRSKTHNQTSSRYIQIQEEFKTRFRTSKLSFVWLFTPIVVSIVMLAQSGQEATNVDFFLPIKDVVMGLLYSTYPKTLFLIIYTVILDIIVRMTLVTKGVNVDRLLIAKNRNHRSNDISNDKELNAENLIVQSILAGFGAAIVEEIFASHSSAGKNGSSLPPFPPHSSGLVAGGMLMEKVVSDGAFPMIDLETDENHRYSVTMSCVADAITSGSVSGCTSLQDNLLRTLILESLGGSNGLVGDSEDLSSIDQQKKNEKSIFKQQTNLLPVALSPHRYRLLKRLRCGPGTVPVVRSLCAYVGGLGVALKRCSVQSSSTTNMMWSLPPCASESVEYAIVAAARIVALTIKDRSAENFRRKHNRISPLILIVLQAAYQLRCGLLMHVMYLMHFEGEHAQLRKEGFYEVSTDAGTKNLCKYIRAHYRDINHVLVSCNKAATELMQVINGHNIAKAGRECEAWLKTL